MPVRFGSSLLRYLLMASTWHIPTKPEHTCVSALRMRCALYWRRFLTSPSWDGFQTARSCWYRGRSLLQERVCGLYPSWVATRDKLATKGGRLRFRRTAHELYFSREQDSGKRARKSG